MHSSTITTPASIATKPSFDWMALLETILLVQLREELDVKAVDGRDAAPFVRGL